MKISRNIALLTALMLILTYTLLSGKVFETAYADEKNNGSTIAGVSVQGLKTKEIENALTTAIDEWSSQKITIVGGGATLEVDPTYFTVEIGATIEQYKTLSGKPWYAFWQSERVVHQPLVITINEDVKEQISQVGIWDVEKTYDTLLSVASYLKSHEVEATVLDLTQFESERLAFSIKPISEKSKGISDIVSTLNNTIINPGDTFSLLSTLEDTANLANSETLSFVASMLYSVVLETEYDIVERHQQQTIPTAFDAGYEASISLANYEDLQFINNSDHVSKLKLSIEGNSLKVELYSDVIGATVSHRIVKDSISPKIVHRYSNDLPAGKQKVLQEGKKGLRVEVYRTVSEDGNSTEQKISRDYYPPTNRIILVSSRKTVEVNTSTTPTDGTNSNDEQKNNQDKDLDIDLDGDGLPDTTVEKPIDEKDLPKGSYYDKAGNLITP